MKERPILFNAPMVRAILDGRKTQTRRVVPSWQLPSRTKGEDIEGLRWMSIAQRHQRWGFGVFGSTEEECMANHTNDYQSCCPYGKPGDRLWVRETFAYGLCTRSTMAYKATHQPSDLEEGWNDSIKWTPSIHMPRWASRILLEIVSVRVERLNEISEDDAKAEGIERIGSGTAWRDYTRHGIYLAKSGESFRTLWKSINGDDSWQTNPWVWVVEFKRIDSEGGHNE